MTCQTAGRKKHRRSGAGGGKPPLGVVTSSGGAAVRAKRKLPLQRSAAGRAAGRPRRCSGRLICAVCRPGLGTVVAEDKRLAGFDLHQRDEKQAEIMIHPPQICLQLAAPRTPAGGFFQFSVSGLNAGNQEHTRAPPVNCDPSRLLRIPPDFCNMKQTGSRRQPIRKEPA